jgi:hypothetical protein
MVLVRIGPNSTCYQILRALPLHYADYFRGALQPCWKEGEEQKIVIEDLETAPFVIFVD